MKIVALQTGAGECAVRTVETICAEVVGLKVISHDVEFGLHILRFFHSSSFGI